MSNDTLQQIRQELTEIREILARQEESLKLHIYRTELAEENIQMLRAELRPVQKHVDLLNTLGKIALATIPVLIALLKLKVL